MMVDGLASYLELHLLDVTFTVEEVAKAVCKLKGMKTAGQDGLMAIKIC